MNKEKHIIEMIKKTLSSTMNSIDDITNSQRPNKFYKYRTCNQNNISNLKDGKAWFSSPLSWNDKIDCTILLDLERLCKDYESNPYDIILKYGKKIINIFEKKSGVKIKKSDNELSEFVKFFYENGALNNDGRKYLELNCSESEIEQYNFFEGRINDVLKSDCFEKAINYLICLNDCFKNNINAYCLSETGTNNAQWAKYADEEKGFCIEYTLLPTIKNDFTKNLYPIIYEKKEEIDLIELLLEFLDLDINNGELQNSDIIQKVILSLLTKGVEWSSEEEWRIILNKNEYPNNLVDFDFASAIILGKDINNYYKKRLLKIAKEKNLKVYQRKLNATNSCFIIEEIVL